MFPWHAVGGGSRRGVRRSADASREHRSTQASCVVAGRRVGARVSGAESAAGGLDGGKLRRDADTSVGRILRFPSSSPPIESVRDRLPGIEHERARRLAKPSPPARRWMATEAGMLGDWCGAWPRHGGLLRVPGRDAHGLPVGSLRSALESGVAPATNVKLPRASRGHLERGPGRGEVAASVRLPRASRGHPNLPRAGA